MAAIVKMKECLCGRTGCDGYKKPHNNAPIIIMADQAFPTTLGFLRKGESPIAEAANRGNKSNQLSDSDNELEDCAQKKSVRNRRYTMFDERTVKDYVPPKHKVIPQTNDHGGARRKTDPWINYENAPQSSDKIDADNDGDSESSIEYDFENVTIPDSGEILQHYAKTGKCAIHMLKKRICFDARITIADQICVQGHKIVLAAHSKKLQHLLIADKRSMMTNITLDNISHAGFIAFLNFAYTGKVKLNLTSLPETLEAAEKLDASVLLNVCHEFLDNMTADGALTIWIKYKGTKENKAILYAHTIILESFVELVESPLFKKIPLEKMKELLMDDNLNVESEYDVLRAIHIWSNGFIKTQHSIIKLLECVRFTFVPIERLLQLKHVVPYIFENKEVELRILRAIWDHSCRMHNMENCLYQSGDSTPRNSYASRFGIQAEKPTFNPPRRRSVGFQLPEEENPESFITVGFVDKNYDWIKPNSDNNKQPEVKIETPYGNKNPKPFIVVDQNVDKNYDWVNGLKSGAPKSKQTMTNQEPVYIDENYFADYDESRNIINIATSVVEKEAMSRSCVHPTVTPDEENIPIPDNSDDSITSVDMKYEKRRLSNPFSMTPGCAISDEPLYASSSQCNAPFPGIMVLGGLPADSSGLSLSGHKVYTYSPGDSEWSLMTALPEPRHLHQTIYMKGHIFVIGGCHPDDYTPGGIPKASNTVFKYCMKSGGWSEAEPMNHARVYHRACLLGSKIYVVGGQDEDSVPLSSVEVYDIKRNKWVKTTNMHHPRLGASVEAFRGKIFVAGGYEEQCDRTSGKPVLRCVEVYNPLCSKWISKKPLRFPRCHATMIVINDELFLCGGATKSYTYKDSLVTSISTVDRYIPEADEWEYKTRMEVPRHGAAGACIDNKLYLIGGLSSIELTGISSIECYDMKTEEWISNIPDLPGGCIGISAISLPNEFDHP